MSGVGLFAGTLARGPVAAAVEDAAWLRVLLDVEGGLSRACVTVGLVAAERGEEIARVCADVARFDVAALGAGSFSSGNPVLALVADIRRQVTPEAAASVHLGATSQDVIDTAMMVLASRAAAALAGDLRGARTAAADLALAHRDTVVAGRTLLQSAVPTTFGLVVAGWLAALDGASVRLAAVTATLPVQYAGAVGTLAASRGRGRELRAELARELGLASTALGWHTQRLPIADLAGAWATLAGVVAGISLDVVLLAQTEVGELREGLPGRGLSSTMPHKRNPVAAISARACALRAPALAATLLAAMPQEQQRAAGSWHTEWETLTDLLRLTGSAMSWLHDCLAHLEVDSDRMLANAAPAIEAARLHLPTGEPAPLTGEAGAQVDEALRVHLAVSAPG